MIVRRAVVKDLKRIQELNLLLFEKEFAEYDNSLSLDWTFGKVGSKYFKDAITKEDSCVFVVEDGGKVVGYLAGGECSVEDYRKLSKVAELNDMLVLEEFRGKGVGKMLYSAFVDWCRKRGVKRVRVEATAQNKEAIEFYRKVGIKDYSLVLEGEI